MFPGYPRATTVTPSDTVNLPFACHAIYVGVTGNVTYIDAAGNTVVLKAVLQGHVHHGVLASRIKSTGTTATDIVALGPLG